MSDISDKPAQIAIVIGAGGSLGQALYEKWQNDNEINTVIGISRQPQPQQEHTRANSIWYQTDYSQASIDAIKDKIEQQPGVIRRVCICNGMLHDQQVAPEKRLEQCETDVLHKVFQVNAVIPLLWIKSLLPALRSQHMCVVTVFSARIGSIGDNYLGGWYAYRASKAALNMMLKTATIEYARRAKNVKLIAFHPGTTDTPLSKPFHASVEDHNLFSPQYVAQHLVDIMNNQQLDGELSFVDRENKAIVW